MSCAGGAGDRPSTAAGPQLVSAADRVVRTAQGTKKAHFAETAAAGSMREKPR
jgi:hypothetical protein